MMQSTVSTTTEEMISCGMLWEIIWRSVSMSFV